jgi:uncharacterized damage-inducible protein DinB
MDIAQACIYILDQLIQLVNDIDKDDYVRPSIALSNATIGQHLRHTLEFFICFEQGFAHGIINYDKRAHDKIIEVDKILAQAAIAKIKSFVASLNSRTTLRLEAGYNLTKDKFTTIETNAMRELVYNIEHAVHHMAIMKIGVREVAPYIKLPFDFGIAASTIRYKETSVKETN